MTYGIYGARYSVGLALATVAFATISNLFASQLEAALTTYATRPDWQAAVGEHLTEDFEWVTDFTPIPDTGGTFAAPHFDIIVDANHGRIGPATEGFFVEYLDTPLLTGKFFVGDVHSPEVFPPHFNTIKFSRPVTAFAANFGALDDGGIYDIRIAGESLELGPPYSGPNRSDFLGVVSTTPFTVVDIRNSNGVLERYGMDNVSFVLIPEPAARPLALIGMVALNMRRQRASRRHDMRSKGGDCRLIGVPRNSRDSREGAKAQGNHPTLLRALAPSREPPPLSAPSAPLRETSSPASAH